jgi:hypothetical protein
MMNSHILPFRWGLNNTTEVILYGERIPYAVPVKKSHRAKALVAVDI